jgi:hypothetical protein
MDRLYVNRYSSEGKETVAVVRSPEEGERVQAAFYESKHGADYWVETKRIDWRSRMKNPASSECR